MTHNCYSDSMFRDDVLFGMARAFFACAYVDFVERKEENEEEEEEYPRPGPGEDWMDFLPSVIPGNAWALAGQLWEAVERLNGASMTQISQRIEAQEAKRGRTPNWIDFGFCLAMQNMGHGVSWADDHEDHGLEIPYREVSGWSFDRAAYREPT
jgi:hypothetical protein